MVELDRARHAEPLHDTLRCDVAKRGNCNDFAQADAGKAVRYRRARCLGCVSLAPEAAVETPGNLDSRGERRFEADMADPDCTDERRHPRGLDRPFAEAVLRHVALDA